MWVRRWLVADGRIPRHPRGESSRGQSWVCAPAAVGFEQETRPSPGQGRADEGRGWTQGTDGQRGACDVWPFIVMLVSYQLK